uniref:Uncharacterized protein n=1 Tax=Meloidogyne enterolobii TaxID=390850 RepID=A0A6V7UYP2_MELEN|nr:unnamed protein product [Meloidogyne enterolobii]
MLLWKGRFLNKKERIWPSLLLLFFVFFLFFLRFFLHLVTPLAFFSFPALPLFFCLFPSEQPLFSPSSAWTVT